MAVLYPAPDRISAIVVSFVGMPPNESGPKFLVTPVRRPKRPVSRAAREGVHTDAPAWKSVNLHNLPL
jgi:hypothetical protein